MGRLLSSEPRGRPASRPQLSAAARLPNRPPAASLLCVLTILSPPSRAAVKHGEARRARCRDDVCVTYGGITIRGGRPHEGVAEFPRRADHVGQGSRGLGTLG